MRLQIDDLGKVSITIAQNYWDINKDYDKLTVVQVEDKFATYISRKPVPAGTVLTDRVYWIPFSSLKEDIVIDYNGFKDKYGKELVLIKDRLNTLEEISSRYVQLEDKVKNLTELAEVNIEKSDDLIERSQAIIEQAENNKVVLDSLPSQILNNTRVEYIQQSDENKLNIVQSEYTKQNDGTYIKQREDTKKLIPLARNTGNNKYVEGLMSAADKQYLDKTKNGYVSDITNELSYSSMIGIPFVNIYYNKNVGDAIEKNKLISLQVWKSTYEPYDTTNYGIVSRYYANILDNLANKGYTSEIKINSNEDCVGITYYKTQLNEGGQFNTISNDVNIPLANKTNAGCMPSMAYKWFDKLKGGFLNRIRVYNQIDDVYISIESCWPTRSSQEDYTPKDSQTMAFIDAVNNSKAGVMTPTMLADLNSATDKLNAAGTANGLAVLDENCKIPANNLPSFVDDVLEYDDFASLPSTGEVGKIYVTLDTNLTYRWSGSQYIEISKSLALGETSSTAFAGDRGKVLETKVSNIEIKNTNQDTNIQIIASKLVDKVANIKLELTTNNILERGVDNTVKLHFYSNLDSICDVSYTLKDSNGTIYVYDIEKQTAEVTIDDDKTFILEATIKDIKVDSINKVTTDTVIKSTSLYIETYDPIYYGSYGGEEIEDFNQAIQQGYLNKILINPSEQIKVSTIFSSDRYNYICIPNYMQVKSIIDASTNIIAPHRKIGENEIKWNVIYNIYRSDVKYKAPDTFDVLIDVYINR